MIETQLKELFQRIFDFKKTSLDDPGDSLEQEHLFIQIDQSRDSIKDGKHVSLVEGQAFVYAPNNKLPFGYFSKAIKSADADDTSKFFFFDFEKSEKLSNNIVRRSLSFFYFFEEQYDPNIGTITSVTIEDES